MRTFHITTNTTTNLANLTVNMRSLRLAVTGSPSDWVIKVQNKETPAKVYHVTDPIDSPTTIQLGLDDVNGHPGLIPMVGGIDIVTTGTTPGTLDAWLDAHRSQ